MSAHVLQGVILLPILGAFCALGGIKRNAAAYAVTLISTLAALVGAAYVVAQNLAGSASPSLMTVGSLPLGPRLHAPLQLQNAQWTSVVALVALFVSLCVQLFARWYLYSDPRYRAFTATVSLFTAAMLLVVTSNDVLLTLVGWEVMGWCSFLLIGHESNQPGPRRAAAKAFLVTRLADAPFVVGIAVLAAGAKTTRISDIVTHWSHMGHTDARLLAILGVICGVLGKSAQFPFTDWLPDAMEGPTPASALIHAATMVAAGSVVLAQLEPILATESTARLTLVILAGATSAFAAFSAFLQPDIKRLLAWSTVSQVGLMLLGLGVIEPGESTNAVILHLVGHAFFKSLLFLLVGWLSVAVGSTLVSRMNGSVRKLPSTFGPTAAALVTMAGLPPTVAFVSKDAMLTDAGRSSGAGFLSGGIGFVLLLIIVVGTAAYSTRMWLILQHRTTLQRRGEQVVLNDSHTVRDVGIIEMLRSSPEVDEHGDEIENYEVYDEDEVLPRPGLLVRLSLLILALGGLFGGLLVFTPLLRIDESHVNLPLMGATVLLVIATGLIVRMMSLRQLYGDASRPLGRHLPLAASRGFGLERVYTAAVATPVMALARAVRSADDRFDARAVSLGDGARTLSTRLDTLHTRKPSTGLFWVVVGFVVIAVLGVSVW